MTELETLREQVANQELTILRMRADNSTLAARVANLEKLKNTLERSIDALCRKISTDTTAQANAAFREW